MNVEHALLRICQIQMIWNAHACILTFNNLEGCNDQWAAGSG